MKTIKKGSKDKAEVMVLQKALGITVDGDFGPKTEAALKEFQKKKGLTPDGICGHKTWEALGVKDTSTSKAKCVDPSVVFLPLSTHITRATGRPIKYLAIHYTAGGSSEPGRARHIHQIFQNRQASADFAVDDKEMVQFNPDINNYYCWAVGDARTGIVSCPDANNKNTISIEICSNLKKGTSAAKPNHDGWYFTEASLNNTIKLCHILMKKFNIPLKNVIRHYDVSGKLCPGVVGWNNGKLYTTDGKATTKKNNSEKWLEFKSKL